MTTHEQLHKAIKDHSGLSDSDIRDAGNHGADTGWGGFTYYTDTCEFYEKNHEQIWELLNESAEAQDVSCAELISQFGIKDSIINDHTFKNALAWFALEEIGHWLESQTEEIERR